MAKDNTPKYSGCKRTNSLDLSPRKVNKKRYIPITNNDVPNYDNMKKVGMDLKKVKKKLYKI